MSTGPDVPPYQIQTLLNEVFAQTSSHITCAQALGNEIYVGTSNGELFQFMLQLDGDKVESYIILSRLTIPGEKPINDIVLIPSISRALILSDRQIHFYILPFLEPDTTKPIRNVVAFAVDDQHLRRPAPKSNADLGYTTVADPVEFSVVKRAAIAMFSLKDRLFYLREIPLPQTQGSNTVLARRAGKYLCFADKENYNMVDLEGAQLFPLLPIAQAPSKNGAVIKPMINVISENEFLILSWTGTNTLGLFITGDGDPVRGTLEWPAYPLGICLDYPHITTLLPDGTVEVHSVDTQAQLQVIGPPPALSRPTSPEKSPTKSPSIASPREQDTMPPPSSLPQRVAMVASVGGYYVPSLTRSECMRKVPFKLLRTP